jgi:cardiolipin synthase
LPVRLIPNFLTLLRLFSSPVLAWLILQGRFQQALLLVGFAATTDWLDGYTARRFRVSGHSGLVLDPLADKVMLVTLFCALTYLGLIPLWFFVLAVVRDLVIVLGALLVRLFRNVRRFQPVMLGKVSTFFQLTFVLLALVLAAWRHPIIFWLERTALVLSTLFTVTSGIAYVRIGVRLAAQPRKTNSIVQGD